MSETHSTAGEELPTLAPEGTIRVPSFDLPLSAALSEEARRAMLPWLSRGGGLGLPSFDGITDDEAFATYVDAFRRDVDENMARPASEALAARFPVEMEASVIGGVPVEDFRSPGVDSEAVLINLHGGAFIAGAKYMGRVESIPLAHLGGFRILSVDYRQGYEHKFPAASEDVATVYESLLREYPSSRIGIYGGSAGGTITAQSVAWLIHNQLPLPGASGILSAGGGLSSGDSTYFSAITHAVPAPEPGRDPIADLARSPFSYFSEVDPSDPLAHPVDAAPEVHAQFPPTLFLTGTRAFDLSPAIAFHRALVRANVDAWLHVFDGLGHCFYYGCSTPEALDAYDTMVRFFHRYLVDG